MYDKIIDNRHNLLGDDLAVELKKGSKVRIAASCFTLFAYNELREQFADISELKVFFTQPTYTNADYVSDSKKEKREFFIPKELRELSLFGTEFEMRLRNKMSLKAIAKECAEWVKQKVQFKSNTTSGSMQSFIAIEQVDGAKISYFPTPSEFSASGLGFQKSNDIMTGIFKSESTAEFWIKQFDDVFSDFKNAEDVTQQVLSSLSSAYKENSPEFLYFIILYNIFYEFLSELSEDNMPNEATGFKNTKLWAMLYDFQKDGVISIINKLQKHNGCILADSVGLGKTLTALAVILYYSLRNQSVLVLCPKRLGENWTQYSGNSNDTTNIFYEDRIRYEVLYHTDLGRNGVAHNGRNLNTINWGNYDLVIIDESHNFRNNNPSKDRQSRYDFLINNIIKPGIKTKVLMLSATPVNNRYNDLKNQLALAYAQNYESFEESLDTTSKIDTIFKNAQAVFNEWNKQPASKRSSKELIDSLSIDFKILLDSVTIARSRKNITKYYNINSIGKFPNRLPPQSHYPELTLLDGVPTYNEIYTKIKELNLSVYGLFDYVLDSQKLKYERQYSVEMKSSGLAASFEKGRVSGIKRLMTVNLLKRLESSVEAFRITMKNMLETNQREIRMIDRYQEGSLRPEVMASKKVFDYQQVDPDEDGSLNLVPIDKGKDIEIDYADIDRISWKNSMLRDVETLKELILGLEKITPQADLKLQTLKDIISNKIKNPINEGNKKVLIFSAFADTANYVYENISVWLKSEYNLESSLIEGDGNKATLKHTPKRTDHLLTMFSPISKNRAITFARIPQYIKNLHDPKLRWSKNTDRHEFDDAMKDIDILVATDCISEGQNLQDCDICINYDIHWNPVRIVQRFGRIDRLGSKNENILLVNFWPPLPLNEYINLTDRVQSRMTIVDQTATADDNLLSPDDQIDDYREVQIQKLQKGENIDLEDNNNGVSISDLGLNEFRMDVIEYLKTFKEPNLIPKGMHAVVKADFEKNIVPGIIFVLRNCSSDILAHTKNLLHPYYLVYLDDKGNPIYTYLQPKRILEIVRTSCKDNKEPIKSVCNKFNLETDDGLKMDKYNKLLSKAINSIIDTKAQSDIMSILHGDTNAFVQTTMQGLDDFELVAFVVIK